MDKVVTAALLSWTFDPRVILLLLVTAAIYIRGWRRVRKSLPEQFSSTRLLTFLSGLLLLFIAVESPLDAFSSLMLQAHMVQHLLLMMVVPPLLLLGQPLLPMLRGLPRTFVKEGLGPFLRWRALQRVGGLLLSPVFAWAIFNISAVTWHVPALYELTLRSPAWHDVEHAVFFWTAILFWWPVVQPWPSKPRWNRWATIPYLLLADIVNTAISATFVFSDKVLYPTYAAAPLSGISPHDDQVSAGVLMWVPGSMFYLIPSVAIAMRLLSTSKLRHYGERKALVQIATRRKDGRQTVTGLLRAFLRWRFARPAMQSVLFGAAAAVVIDGLRGPKMAPMNLAGVLPWVHWRGLAVIALLAVGNLFCMACPFMLPRNAARRFFAPKWRWPSALRSKWVAVALFVIYLWAYEAFSFWDSPMLTAWIVIGYFLTAFVVDALFRGATFCKYVCPLGQFNFVQSLLSPFEVKVREQATCRSCRTFDCIRGNETQRGCELYLFQPKKASNFDCTFCLDCIHACPHDNVSIVPVTPARTLLTDPYRSSIGRFSKRPDIAALFMIFVFGAFANALAMTQPFLAWEQGAAAGVGRPLVIAAFIALAVIVIPGCVILAAWEAAAGRGPALQFSAAMVPLGAAMWTAHLIYHLFTGFVAIVPVTQRLLHDALRLPVQPDWRLASIPILPAWLTPMQLLLLDAGLLVTLYVGWRISTSDKKQVSAGRVFLPWASMAVALYGVGVWILLEPMQMRGMMMMN